MGALPCLRLPIHPHHPPTPYRLNAKQKHLGGKKVRGQEEPATKSSDIK